MSSNSFPQLRRDPIVNRWALIAPERAARPGAIIEPTALPNHDAECPFCEGRESQTPSEILADRSDDTLPNHPGWRVRVVPNRFPAVRDELGNHELVVECPDHLASFAQFSDEHAALVLGVVRDRLRAIRDNGRFAYAQFFKNHGTAAGASLAHAHSQIVALAGIPPAIQDELDSALEFQTKSASCIFCELIRKELSEKSRVVIESKHVVAFTAYAGRFPFEAWIILREHSRSFEDTTSDQLVEVARVVRRMLARLEVCANGPAYNLVLHNAPWDESPFHWHFELLPRITGAAGLEWGAGVFINPLPPEEAAAKLRGH